MLQINVSTKMGLFQLPELEEKNVRKKMSIIRMTLLLTPFGHLYAEAAINTSLETLRSYRFGPLVLEMMDGLVWLLISNAMSLRLTVV